MTLIKLKKKSVAAVKSVLTEFYGVDYTTSALNFKIKPACSRFLFLKLAVTSSCCHCANFQSRTSVQVARPHGAQGPRGTPEWRPARLQAPAGLGSDPAMLLLVSSISLSALFNFSVLQFHHLYKGVDDATCIL